MQHDHKAADIFTEKQRVNLRGGLKLPKSKLNKCIMFKLSNFSDICNYWDTILLHFSLERTTSVNRVQH